MGGKGSGGARPGSGAKPKHLAEKVLAGTASLAERQAGAKGQKNPPAQVQPPPGMRGDELKVWKELAPHAIHAHTLTRGTSYAFRMLCRNVVLEREIAKDKSRRGGSDHRGLMQRLDSQLQAFQLRPMGKPVFEDPPAPNDPFDAFAEFDVPSVN